MQTFRAGGKGGGNQNARSTGVRLIHHASGASAEARDTRHQHDNKKAAFIKLIETKEFKVWHKIQCAILMRSFVAETPEEIMKRVDAMIAEGLRDGSIVIESLD